MSKEDYASCYDFATQLLLLSSLADARKHQRLLISRATVNVVPLTSRNAETLISTWGLGSLRRGSSKSTAGHGSTSTRIESRPPVFGEAEYLLGGRATFLGRQMNPENQC